MKMGAQELKKVLETIQLADVEEDNAPLYSVFSKQNKNFEVLELEDNIPH